MTKKTRNRGPIRVLVSGAGGDAGQGVMKALQRSSLDIEIFATCIRAESPWLHHPAIQGFVAPPSASDAYVAFLCDLLIDYGIHAFVPTVDSEMVKIARARDHISRRTGAVVMVGEPSDVEVADDKALTIEFLRQQNVAHPRTALGGEETAIEELILGGFPLIVKPRQGQGGRGVRIVSGFDKLEPWVKNPDYVIQEWLDPAEGEFTTGIYLGRDHEVKGICTFRRELRGGSTYVAERFVDRALEEPLERVAIALGLPYVNIQSIRRGGELVPFELNARLSGTTAMVSRVFNAPEMYLTEHVLGRSVERSNNMECFTAMRYYEEVFATPDQIESLRMGR